MVYVSGERISIDIAKFAQDYILKQLFLLPLDGSHFFEILVALFRSKLIYAPSPSYLL